MVFLPCSLNPRQPGFLGHKELQAQQPPARELSQAELAWGAARGYNFAATSQQPQQLGQQQCKGMQQQQQSMVAEQAWQHQPTCPPQQCPVPGQPQPCQTPQHAQGMVLHQPAGMANMHQQGQQPQQCGTPQQSQPTPAMHQQLPCQTPEAQVWGSKGCSTSKHQQ